MKTNCPKYSTAIIVEAHEVIYDGEDYVARCPSCQTYLIAHAHVVITYQLKVAEVDEDGPLRYTNDSVDMRIDTIANVNRLLGSGCELNPDAVQELARRAGVPQ